MATTTHTRLIRIKEVTHLTGLPRATVYDYVKKGLFPKQVSLGGGKAVAWVEREIQQWINERIGANRMKA